MLELNYCLSVYKDLTRNVPTAEYHIYGYLCNRADHYIFKLWFVMVALWNMADHYIFALWLLLSFFFYSLPNLSRRRLDVCHTSTQFCRAISSQLRHASTIVKNLLSINMSSTCPHNMVNFGPLAAEIGLPVWGTPANFNGFHVLAALLRRWTEGATYVWQGDHHVGHWPTF